MLGRIQCKQELCIQDEAAHLDYNTSRVEEGHDQQYGKETTDSVQKEVHPIWRVGELLGREGGRGEDDMSGHHTH